jgi:hypothetical protein
VERLEAVVARRPPTHLDLHAPDRQVELVVDDHPVCEVLDPVAPHQRLGGTTGIVHIGLRECDHDPAPCNTDLRCTGMGPSDDSEPLTSPRREQHDGVCADVVTSVLELGTRVSEAENEQAA